MPSFLILFSGVGNLFLTETNERQAETYDTGEAVKGDPSS